MERKNLIVSIAKRNKNKYGEMTPGEVYTLLKADTGFKTMFDLWSSKDIITLIFLLTTPINDLSVAYDVISMTLYGYQMVELLEQDPDVDCDECGGGGYQPCDECDGRGEITCSYCDEGDVECDVCGGDGKDEEEDCDECEGKGYKTCDECGGNGSSDCGYCENGDIDCQECNGSGEVTKYDNIKYSYKEVITYNPSIMNKFSETDKITKINPSLFEATTKDKFSFVIELDEAVTDEFNDFEIGDVLLTQIIDNQALELKKNRYGNIYCSNFNQY